jgi:hypothetical protein
VSSRSCFHRGHVEARGKTPQRCGSTVETRFGRGRPIESVPSFDISDISIVFLHFYKGGGVLYLVFRWVHAEPLMIEGDTLWKNTLRHGPTKNQCLVTVWF